VRQEGHRAVDHPPEVDVHDLLDVAEGQVLDVPGERDPGVVDDQVHRAVLGDDHRGVGEHRVAVGDVEALLVHGGAELAGPRGRLGESPELDVADREPRTLGGELEGQAPAHARRRAGDDCNLAGEALHALTSR